MNNKQRNKAVKAFLMRGRYWELEVKKAQRKLDDFLGSTFSSYGDISPSVRPVVDLSELEASMNGVNGAFSTGTFTFDGYDSMMGELNNLSLGMDNFHQDNQYLADAVDGLHTDNEEQNEKIDDMNGMLAQYLPYLRTVGNQKIVLDSGVLVGELEGPLDEALAERQAMSVRSGR